MLKPIVRYERDVAFRSDMPFPVKVFLSKSEAPTASVRLAMLDKGRKIELHAHVESDQIEYCIRGRGIMFIEGLGEKEIVEGTFTYVPRGVKHSLLEVIEPLTILTVFVPPIF
ncbi:MAG: cupin domain-containing protein [Candidatus Bathyarchaeia archaeon]|nr:cupin domain-containing protein [Candidatus Bathyarchaeota archaeon]